MEGISDNSKKESPCTAGADCGKFAEIVHSVIDGEATCDDVKFFEAHAEKCVDCLEHYEIQKEFVEEIRAKLARKCCPDQVLKSIKNKLEELK